MSHGGIHSHPLRRGAEGGYELPSTSLGNELGSGDTGGLSLHPNQGDIYLDYEANILYVCYADGTWTNVIAGLVGNHPILDGSVHSDSVADGVTRGSLIYGNATPKWDELVVGTTGQYLGTDGTDVLWRAQSTLDHGSIGGLTDDDHTQYVLKSLIDAAGDLYVGLSDNTPAKLSRGSDGQALRSTASGIAWENDDYQWTFIIDGGGSAITTGVKGYAPVPTAGTIVRAELLADQSGSIVVDLWKDTYANYPPTVADTITASDKPTISAATKDEDTTLTGWTTTVAAGDIIGVNVDSAATVERVTVALRIRKT